MIAITNRYAIVPVDILMEARAAHDNVMVDLLLQIFIHRSSGARTFYTGSAGDYHPVELAANEMFLSAEAVAEHNGVSRRPVRDRIAKLVRRGLIESRVLTAGGRVRGMILTVLAAAFGAENGAAEKAAVISKTPPESHTNFAATTSQGPQKRPTTYYGDSIRPSSSEEKTTSSPPPPQTRAREGHEEELEAPDFDFSQKGQELADYAARRTGRWGTVETMVRFAATAADQLAAGRAEASIRADIDELAHPAYRGTLTSINRVWAIDVARTKVHRHQFDDEVSHLAANFAGDGVDAAEAIERIVLRWPKILDAKRDAEYLSAIFAAVEPRTKACENVYAKNLDFEMWLDEVGPPF